MGIIHHSYHVFARRGIKRVAFGAVRVISRRCHEHRLFGIVGRDDVFPRVAAVFAFAYPKRHIDHVCAVFQREIDGAPHVPLRKTVSAARTRARLNRHYLYHVVKSQRAYKQRQYSRNVRAVIISRCAVGHVGQRPRRPRKRVVTHHVALAVAEEYVRAVFRLSEQLVFRVQSGVYHRDYDRVAFLRGKVVFGAKLRDKLRRAFDVEIILTEIPVALRSRRVVISGREGGGEGLRRARHA